MEVHINETPIPTVVSPGATCLYLVATLSLHRTHIRRGSATHFLPPSTQEFANGRSGDTIYAFYLEELTDTAKTLHMI